MTSKCLTISSNMQQLYTAAIALNNIAISLIERGLYLPASEALNGAAMLMKDISQLSLILHQRSCAQEDETCRKTAVMVRRAESYLGLSGHSHSTHLTIRVVNEDSAASAIGAIQDNALKVCDTKHIVVIQMEVGSIQDLRNRNPNVDSSFILYNLACAQLCRAFTCQLRSSSYELLQKAQRLFLFSLTVLENVIDDKEAEVEGNIDETDVCYILPAVIIVLRNLARTASMLGQHDDIERFSSQADSFEEFFVEEVYLSVLFAPLAAAAA